MAALARESGLVFAESLPGASGRLGSSLRVHKRRPCLTLGRVRSPAMNTLSLFFRALEGQSGRRGEGRASPQGPRRREVVYAAAT